MVSRLLASDSVARRGCGHSEIKFHACVGTYLCAASNHLRVVPRRPSAALLRISALPSLNIRPPRGQHFEIFEAPPSPPSDRRGVSIILPFSQTFCTSEQTVPLISGTPSRSLPRIRRPLFQQPRPPPQLPTSHQDLQRFAHGRLPRRAPLRRRTCRCEGGRAGEGRRGPGVF